MEEDIYSKPVKGRKVKSTQAEEAWQETGDYWREEVVDIYVGLDVAGPQAQQQEPAPQSMERETQTGVPANRQNKRLSTVAGCLALLCLLLLAGLIGLLILQVRVTGLNERMRSALGNAVQDLNTTLTQQHALQKMLKDGGVNICKCWQKGSSCSCYYISNSKESWLKSQQACKESGSDLIVINSSEEKQTCAPHFHDEYSESQQVQPRGPHFRAFLLISILPRLFLVLLLVERHLHLVFLSVGLLCFLQAGLNIALRLGWKESRDLPETTFQNVTRLCDEAGQTADSSMGRHDRREQGGVLEVAGRDSSNPSKIVLGPGAAGRRWRGGLRGDPRSS
ncbi:hypothetical protein NHX12_018118 [Muraenolepis orangiensis]|uniref:C-type lectin domain-containing protein n=1 Tax=Muraenolepis orangiensis TaxID=630683 RepID=A0A9Q0IYL8_9TELE|nr:hypothetical protein NHX12_018118 [Muraenolepis orangiensis]